jgi:hypothetical protein
VKLKLAIVLVVGTIAPATAQTLSWPASPTLPAMGTFTDVDGKQIGTTATMGNRIYIRDLKGEHLATIVIEADGTRTIYDPHGKVIDQMKPK